MYLDSIHSDFYSIVRIDDNQLYNNGSFSGKGGVAIMYRKSVSFSVKEISCFDSNCVIGIQLTDNGDNSWYIFGVYLPSDNNIEAYVQKINIVDNLYNYYSRTVLPYLWTFSRA
jgi:exonuclease III